MSKEERVSFSNKELDQIRVEAMKIGAISEAENNLNRKLTEAEKIVLWTAFWNSKEINELRNDIQALKESVGKISKK